MNTIEIGKGLSKLGWLKISPSFWQNSKNNKETLSIISHQRGSIGPSIDRTISATQTFLTPVSEEELVKIAAIDEFIPINKPLRVSHYPELGMNPFYTEAKDEKEAFKIINTLADHHLYLFNSSIINDYSNMLSVEMCNFPAGEESLWEDYYNNEMDMDWEEVERTLV